MSNRWIVCWALTPLLGLPALAQSVISAHSGLVHFSDGAVFLDDQFHEGAGIEVDEWHNFSAAAH